jgi:hypothetical protein
MIREVQMGQLGFFDTEKRLAALSAELWAKVGDGMKG